MFTSFIMAENYNAVRDNIGAGVGAIGFMENVPGDGFGDEESEDEDGGWFGNLL